MARPEKSDLFVVLAYIAFALAPMTRDERVRSYCERIFSNYDDKTRQFLDFVFAQYVKEGVRELDDNKLPDLLGLKCGALHDATQALCKVADIRKNFNCRRQ